MVDILFSSLGWRERSPRERLMDAVENMLEQIPSMETLRTTRIWLIDPDDFMATKSHNVQPLSSPMLASGAQTVRNPRTIASQRVITSLGELPGQVMMVRGFRPFGKKHVTDV